MPELPDVETMRRYLESEGLGRRIDAVEVLDPLVLRGLDPATLRDALAGRSLTETYRRGKWLFAGPDGGPWLGMHFRMTGALHASAPEEAPPPHTRVSLRFADGGALHFRDQRRLGVVTLVGDLDAFLAAKRLGPDALDPKLTSAEFVRRLSGRRGPLKGMLLDQSLVAGIGNIYGDEICHAARLSPFSRVEHLSAEEMGALFRAMRSVLRTAVERKAGERGLPRAWLIPERHDGGHCPRCGGPVSRRRFQGRYTYWCPCSQREA